MTYKDQSHSGRDALAILAAGGAGAIIASLLSHKPAEGAPGVELPEDIVTALAALVANSSTTVDQLQQILSVLGVTGAVGQNPAEIVIFTIRPPLINTPVQFPEYLVAYDKDLIIRAYPANVGNIFIGNTAAESVNINSAWLLAANDIVGWKIHNTKQLWCSCTVAGDGIMCTAERRP